MRKVFAALSLLLVIVLCYYSFYSLTPHDRPGQRIAKNAFSVDRALDPLQTISAKPHYYGSFTNQEVREFLMSKLKEMGLTPEIQQGVVLDPDSRSLTKPTNIVAKIQGTGKGKALLILAHYDSAAIPSFGASDDGTGLVTILESLRAYLASGEKPKNDIIVLFTDAEEVGLDGARLFVKNHPWAKDVGMAINFEARGTSGPSNMIVETNEGNSGLIRSFMAANPQYPVGSSLFYSIYKMLPNDTDSTILRRYGDIDGFFFAFIDGHYNYHTSQDNFENVSRNSLAQQGSYLLPMLHYFSKVDLSQVKSSNDDVYFNFPVIRMVNYPFFWIFPMFGLAVLVFILLLIFGVYKGKFRPKDIFLGFAPFIASLLITAFIGFFGWKLLLMLYPQYNEIQQGFPYNGHWYIACFVFLTLSITLLFYRKFSKESNQAALMVAPLFFWLLLNAGFAVFLKGGSYFIIPVFFGLFSLFVMMLVKRPNLLIMVILSAPAIVMMVPLIQFFPVGLGLNAVVVSCALTVFLFGLLLPVFSYYDFKAWLAGGCFVVAALMFYQADSMSQFSRNRKKPDSLVYYQDANSGKSLWLTYDKILDPWTEKYLGPKPKDAFEILDDVPYNKYGSAYTFAANAPKVGVPTFSVRLNTDSLKGNDRVVKFTIVPQRLVNRLELYSDQGMQFQHLKFNGKPISPKELQNTYRGTANTALLTYFIAGRDSLVVSFSVKKELPVKFRVYEYSYNLMDNPYLKVDKRPAKMMPKPFVITDAIATRKAFNLADLRPLPMVVPATAVPKPVSTSAPK